MPQADTSAAGASRGAGTPPFGGEAHSAAGAAPQRLLAYGFETPQQQWRRG